MEIDITARHFSPSDRLKEMIYEKLKKIEKFNSDIMNCRVVLTKEANFKDVEIVVNGKGHHFVANENSENFEKYSFEPNPQLWKFHKTDMLKTINPILFNSSFQIL